MAMLPVIRADLMLLGGQFEVDATDSEYVFISRSVPTMNGCNAIPFQVMMSREEFIALKKAMTEIPAEGKHLLKIEVNY